MSELTTDVLAQLQALGWRPAAPLPGGGIRVAPGPVFHHKPGQDLLMLFPEFAGLQLGWFLALHLRDGRPVAALLTDGEGGEHGVRPWRGLPDALLWLRAKATDQELEWEAEYG